ncbi:hypothetical protein [Iodobacter ciconiae]|uniref:Uncharacterized protein n=1 Tax=Iodobacter ciconiae TaxID=2496266 RepID=A0A3S8ZUW1_9NEIS|nr:hypothetical protein [Iodobacter ciconiae]AZN37224.1 hypothetical protein EJO50_12455 [Iodobacter ciconiae]
MKYILLFFLICSSWVHAEWGRLFFSPGERAVARGDASSPYSAEVTEADTIRLDGEINHNGKKIRWLDGELSTSPVPAGLKVGQTLNRQSGEKRDVYQARP